MSIVRIEKTGSESLERAEKLLSGIPGGAEKAVHSAMARATARIRTASSQKIRDVYAISDSEIRTNRNITSKYTYQAGVGLTAEVKFAGHKIPLYRYNGTSPLTPTADTGRTVSVLLSGGWARVHPSVAAAAHQLKSTPPSRLDNGFVVRRSGYTGIFERTGAVTSGKRDQLKELMGSSVPQMLGSTSVQEEVVGAGMQEFDKRMDVEINRILNGWGG